MSDVLISRLANCRSMAARRLPTMDLETIDLAIAEIAEIAELKEAYALLFKAHAIERLTVDRLRTPLDYDAAHDIFECWYHDDDSGVEFVRRVEKAHGICGA